MAVEYPFLALKGPFVPNASMFDGCTLHTPFIVAIRSTAASDQELLTALGLSHYLPCPIEEYADPPQVFIANAGDWTLIADDWAYTLWHANGAALACAGWGDVFAFDVGDCDESYGFDWIEAGQHRRALRVDSPGYNDRLTTRDEGAPLPGESAELFEQDASVIVWTVARALGISLDPHTTKFRRYAAASENLNSG